MRQITIPTSEATTPAQQIHSCGCSFEGMNNYENKMKRKECKMHAEMPEIDYAKDGLEGMY